MIARLLNDATRGFAGHLERDATGSVSGDEDDGDGGGARGGGGGECDAWSDKERGALIFAGYTTLRRCRACGRYV
jgi:hypothetical protein